MKQQERKTRIYLCDMVHNHLGAGSYMFPLNIGYLAAYAIKRFGSDLEIRLFKYPDRLLRALQTEVPDVLGFSNYTWNADLNARLAEHARRLSKETLIVFGGPNIDYTDERIRDFFITHPAADFYIPFQGENPFVNLLTEYLQAGRSRDRLHCRKIDGAYTFESKSAKVLRGAIPGRIKNPDELPSPYLTGLLDEFFEYSLIPIVETNRGCPYGCTFCAQGLSSHHQINYFSLNRVRAELDYIAAHVKNTNILNLADSNFGIVERDLDIARYIAEISKNTGYPRRCNTNWAKNQPKIFKIAEILDNINLAVSLQSLDEKVLQRVKRRNIKTEVFRDIIRKVNHLGGVSGTEIILGLPGETKESHIETLRKLFDWDVSCIICYNGLILDGTELSLSRQSGDFQCRTKYRLVDSSFGRYGRITSFEAEQGILSTDTMTEEELLGFRPVHWLIQFLWNYRFYYDFLKYARSLGVNPLDIIMELIDRADDLAPEKVRQIFADFRAEAKNEWFDSPQALREHYSRPENFRTLEQGLHGKMNGKYIFRMLLEAKEQFERYMLNVACSSFDQLASRRTELAQILECLSSSIIDFNQSWDQISSERFIHSGIDILRWRDLRYSLPLPDRPVKLRFFMPSDQQQSLHKLLRQYDHPNKNVILRKMSEFTSIRDFFYQIETVAAEHSAAAERATIA